MPVPLAQVKNGDKQFVGKACTHEGPAFFLLGKGVGGGEGYV